MFKWVEKIITYRKKPDTSEGSYGSPTLDITKIVPKDVPGGIYKIIGIGKNDAYYVYRKNLIGSYVKLLSGEFKGPWWSGRVSFCDGHPIHTGYDTSTFHKLKVKKISSGNAHE